MVIRTAKLSDIKILTALYAETSEYHNKLDSKYYKEVSSKTTGEFTKETSSTMKKKEIEVYIAEHNDSPVGFTSFKIEREDYFDTKIIEFVNIYEVYVQEKYWGKGYGKALLSKAEQYAKKKSIKHISLHCSSKNPNALAFYKHLGYVDRQRILFKEV